MADRSWAPTTLLLPALLCFGAYLGLVLVDRADGTLRAGTTPTTLAMLAVAAVGYVLAAVVAERSTGERATPERTALPLLWAAPVVFRLLLVLTEPTLSDDVYRYLWDGHVLSNGVNPYSYAISATELDRLQIPIRDLANNPDLSSPYLPTLQLLFAALAVIAPSEPVVIQLVMVGFDLAAAWMIWKLLAVAGLPTNRTLLYLWHPLVIVESAHGAHFDSLMTFLLLAAALTALARFRSTTKATANPSAWPLASPVLLALGVLTRPIPALVAPVLWWRWRLSQRLLFIAVLVVMVVPFGFGSSGWGLFGTPTGTGVFGSARVYSTEFRFNAAVATWLEQLLPNVEAFTTVTGGLMMLVLAAVLWLARPPRNEDNERHAEIKENEQYEQHEVRRLVRLMVVPLAAYVVLTPVFHPWYLVSLIALGLFLAPAPDEPKNMWWLLSPIAYLSMAAPLSYLTYRDPENFRELDWVRRVEWWPTLLLAVVACWILLRLGRLGDREPAALQS